MKTKKSIFSLLFMISVLFMFSKFSNAQFTVSQKLFDPNNSSTYFVNTGIFNQNVLLTNTPGYMWPKGSNKYAIFTTGLNIAAFINDSLRMTAASYKGEYYPGYILNGQTYTDTNFRIYLVKKGDNAGSNPDFANWGTMVPYGAPYVDVNNNGQYDVGVDIPGILNAEQTVFIHLTDGFTDRHSSTEGFGGGTLPLKSDLAITAWGYHNVAIVEDYQFIKFRIINKNSHSWTHTYFGFVADPDLGNANDDYIGCDTSRRLSYCYNKNDYDDIYGTAPPAVGFLLLKSLVNHSVSPNSNIWSTSFTFFSNSSSPSPACEIDPSSATEAYNFLKGFKKDGTPFLNPLVNPPVRTKFCYTGDPETNSGWTEARGSIKNCGGDTSNAMYQSSNPGGDRRLLIGMGAENFTMVSNDTQTIIISQVIARGNSNLNSVTKLKAISDTVKNLYNGGFSNLFYSVSGNVRYLDNSQLVSTGSVKALRLNTSSGQIEVLDSTGIQPDGSYTLRAVPLDHCYIGAVPNSTSQTDYVMTYYPSSIYYRNAALITVSGNITNLNIRVYRKNTLPNTNVINGKININTAPYSPLKDANIYAMVGSTFYGFTTSNSNGYYSLTNLLTGTIKIVADRIGFSSDSIEVNISKSILDSVNFHLTKLYIAVNPISTVVPDNYLLYQNYPNPFNPITNIKFQIKESKSVVLKIYDILGKEVETLINEKLKAGIYDIPFNASALPSGIYFYRLVTDSYSDTKRMVLIK